MALRLPSGSSIGAPSLRSLSALSFAFWNSDDKNHTPQAIAAVKTTMPICERESPRDRWPGMSGPRGKCLSSYPENDLTQSRQDRKEGTGSSGIAVTHFFAALREASC